MYLVLRPNLLSVYKSSSEEQLHKQLNLSDVTAVTILKDPKGRRQNIFGVFLPSRNYHLQAKNDKDAHSWVELLKHEARIDEEEQEILLGRPVANRSRPNHSNSQIVDSARSDDENLGSSSPEPFNFPMHHTVTRDGVSIPGIRRASVHDFDYSGDDYGPSSDLSDAVPPQTSNTTAFGSLLQQEAPGKPNADAAPMPRDSNDLRRQDTVQNGSQQSIVQMEQDEERVIWHGYLLYLRSKGGVKQWRRHWIVLRPKNLAFYKSKDVSISQEE